MRTSPRSGSPLAVALVAVAGACGSPSASPPRVGIDANAIVAGRETEQDDAVVALVSGEATYCTGTYVDTARVVTAAHCVGDGAPNPEQVFFGADVDEGGAFRRVVDVEIHPDFDPGTRAHDVAMLRLDAPFPSTPAMLGALGFDSERQSVRVVGFGVPDAFGGPLVKRTGRAEVLEIGVSSFRIGPGPARPCHGDSGGPVFAVDGGVEYLVGVVSDGDLFCHAYADVARVDSEAADFLWPTTRGGCTATALGEVTILWVVLPLSVLLFAGLRRRDER